MNQRDNETQRLVLHEDGETITIGRKKLEVGDWVKVVHSPGKRDGFSGKIAGWWVDGTIITAIDIWGGKAGYERMRSIRPERVKPLKKQPRSKA